MRLPDEIVGKWFIDPSGQMVGDETTNQIWELVQNSFKRIAHREGGWTILYRDPSDDSHWELTFPQSEMHGGGPPKLIRISPEQIRQRYPELNVS